MSGFVSGFKDPVCMADSSEYDPDKCYKDSKLVRTYVECAIIMINEN